MKKFKVIVMPVVVAALVFFGAGCSNLTKQNYDKLKVGMEYTEVVGILGDAASCDGAMAAKSCMWGSEDKNITVKFVADKVVFMTCKGI